MRALISVLLLGSTLAVPRTYAQSSPPKFEVASIQRCRSNDPPARPVLSPGRLNLNCVTLGNLIRLAYLVYPTGAPNAPVSPNAFFMPLLDAPSWINSERYRIDAKTERPENVEMLQGPMLQALLEERFQLKLHRVTRETGVYELTVAKGGPRLQPAKPGNCAAFDRNHPPPEPAAGQPKPLLCGSMHDNPSGGLDVTGVTVAELCRRLSAYVDRDIVDKTGISGIFDVHLALTLADLDGSKPAADPTSPFTPGDGGALSVALKKLGLLMRSRKAPAHFLVIDRVETPSDD